MEQLSAIRVAVASRNPAKLDAVRTVFGKVWPGPHLVAVDVTIPKEISDMPIDGQIKQGALYRAHGAMELSPGANFAVGAEGGVEFVGTEAYLYNWVAVCGSNGRTQTAPSAKLLLPPAIVRAVRSGRVLGELMQELTGRADVNETDGAVGYFTRGILTRQTFFEECLACALAPFLHPEMYEESAT